MTTSFNFYNYSASPITVTTPDGNATTLAEDGLLTNKSTTGDYKIGYGSVKFTISRDYINKLATRSYYDFFITDSIVLKDPVSASTYTHGTKVNKFSDRSSSTWSVFISPSQSITVTNGSSDGSWVAPTPKSTNWWLIILIVTIVLAIILAIFIGAMYWKHKKMQ